MPSNEDRKAVAAKLRRLEEENHWERARFIVGFIDAIGLETRASVGECLLHLADLIEPEPERTCRIEERRGDWYCTECDELVGTVDTESELFIDGNAIEMWKFCPNCGAKVVSE